LSALRSAVVAGGQKLSRKIVSDFVEKLAVQNAHFSTPIQSSVFATVAQWMNESQNDHKLF
jgi:hypothetical protein